MVTISAKLSSTTWKNLRREFGVETMRQGIGGKKEIILHLLFYSHTVDCTVHNKKQKS